MGERLLLLVLLVAVAMSGYFLFTSLQKRKLKALAVNYGKPKVLYFRSDNCGACPLQSRYLEEVKQTHGDRFILESIDAVLEQQKATQFKVFSLPTTILIDNQGYVFRINYGVTDSIKLSKQIEKLAPAN